MPSTYMGLSLPTPSLTVGPAWASMLNAVLTTVDGHNHTAGSGQQVPSAGLNINADLPFNGFNVTLARTVRFQQQAAAPAGTSDAGCVYVTTAGDLWYNNGAGQHVQLTSGAALAASSLGGISGLSGTSASAAYSAGAGTFTFTSAANTAAIIDGGPLVIRDTVASANGVTLKSPASLAAAYTLTLPTALPASSTFLVVSNAGVVSAPTSVVDGTTLQQSGATLSVKPPSPTVPTVTALWTAGNGLAYWKDAAGTVHLKGVCTYAGPTGGLTMFTLPAGFRPAALRQWVVPLQTSGTTAVVQVDSSGNVIAVGNTTGDRYLDAISFLAEV